MPDRKRRGRSAAERAQRRILAQAELARIRANLPSVFTPSAPVTRTELFAGRWDQITQVMGAVAQIGQHAILYGERGVGKTSLASLIHEFWDQVHKDRELLTPRITCDSTDTFDTIWRKVAEEIDIGKRKRQGTYGDVPGTVPEALAEFRDSDVSPASIRRFLHLADKRFVIIIDEYDRPRDRESLRLFSDTIKTLSDQTVQATLVLVGVADTVEELVTEHASIDRNLVQVLMPRMTDTEIREVVQKALTSAGMTITDEALSLIARLARGLPHYAHLLGLYAATAAVNEPNERLEVTAYDVLGSLGNAMLKTQESTKRAYRRATASNRESIYPEVLLACAMAQVDELGYFAPGDVRTPLSAIRKKICGIGMFNGHLTALASDAKGHILQAERNTNRHRFRFTDSMLVPYILIRGVNEGMYPLPVTSSDRQRPTAETESK